MGEASGPLDRFAGRRPEAITFDFWNTLVAADTARTRVARRAQVTAVLADHGLAVDDAALDAGLALAFERFNEAWAANRQFTGEDGGAVLVEALGLVGHEAAADVVGAFVRAGDGLPHELAPGVADVLEDLRSAGVRIGIVCDVGMTPSWILRGYLEAHDLLGRFDHWSFSDEVGVFKPDPAIFRHALDGLGVDDPAGVAHVGDLIRTDAMGARASGLASVRYAGLHDDAPESAAGGPEPLGEGEATVDADVVIRHHDELPALLGLG